jgi:hypothetical protein
VEAESVVVTPVSARPKLTGQQKWMLTGLFVLQVPMALFFIPLAAIFAITGIFVPIAILLLGIGTLPFTYAMKCRDHWQGGSGAAGSAAAGSVAAVPARPDVPA